MSYKSYNCRYVQICIATLLLGLPESYAEELPQEALHKVEIYREETRGENPIKPRKKTQTKHLNKIVTSATGFDLPLKEETKNMIIIDKKDLQDKGYTNLEQALEKQPSITFIAGSNGTKEIDLRGQGLDASKAVKILINRVPINLQDTGNGGHSAGGVTPFNQINIDEIESIEIIPGGGSVVYGNNTRGGVINIVTKKPNRDYTRISLKGTSFEAANPNSLGSNVNVSGGKKVSDTTFISGNASYSYQRGLRYKEYTQNVYTSLHLTHQINSQQKLDWNMSYARMWRYFAGYYNLFNADGSLKNYAQMKDERYLSPIGSGATDSAKGNITQDFIQTSLNYNNKINEEWNLDIIAFYAFSNFLFPDMTLGVSESNFTNNNIGLNIKAKRQTQRNTLMLGLDNQLEASDNLTKNAFNNLQNKGTKYSLSLYGLDSYNFNEFFSLSGGARGEFSYFHILGHTGVSFGGQNGYFEINAKKPQFAYAIEITPNFHYGESGSIYAKAETGFISPSVRQAVSTDPNYDTSNTGVGPKIASNIKPEQYFTGELGWRHEFDNIYITATAYYTHTLNEIRYNLYGFRTEYYNLGATQRLGFELTSNQNFSIFSLQESLAYLYSNVLVGRETGLTNGGSSTSGNYEGKPIPYVPLLKATILLNAEILNANNHNLNLWWNNSYYGQSVDNNQFVVNKNGYFLSDIGLTYNYNDLTLSVGVQNILDSFYIAYQNTSISSVGTSGIYLSGAGRSYFIEGKYNF
ncbi:TonB-dependent receptor domain-containing protein [Helicobacter trogontum]|uniref:TonB-dependent receptor n=1 Tax=Helicobacter trogontum TaxID=50960 RepID=UPI002A91FC73|nr:TonB-dependent receptor [Helicobacter trogontum]MDY5185168.1 TonB-dependent receptor [Helicobacter trogontum]